MRDFLDRVKWRVTIGRSGGLDDLTPARSRWTNPAEWAWGGYGYGYPGKSITTGPNGGILLEWNPTPDQAVGASQFAGIVVGQIPQWPIEVSFVVIVPEGSPRVRATIGWRTSGGWSQTFGEPESVSLTFTSDQPNADYWIGLESEAGPVGSVEIVDMRVTLQGTDITNAVFDGVRIDYGRPAWLDSTEPSSATFVVDPSRLPQVAALYELGIGQTVAISALVDYSSGDVNPGGATEPYVEMRRFTGKITGLVYRPEIFEVTAAGGLEAMSRLTVGGSDRPVENEVERLRAYLAEAEIPGAVIGFPRFNLAARAADPATGLDLLNDTAGQTGVLLSESRTGMIVAYTSAFLDAVTSTLSIDPDLVPISPYTASATSGGIVNRVTVSYGVPGGAGGFTLTPGSVAFPTATATVGTATWNAPLPVSVSSSGGTYTPPTLQADGSSGGGSSKPWVLRTLAASENVHGRHEQTIDTDLVDIAAATSLADRILAISGMPVWELEALEIAADVASTSSATVREVMNLEAGQRLSLTRRPDYSPITFNVTYAVLGWSEVISSTSWRITYTLGRWSAAVMGTLSFDELGAAGTYLWVKQTSAWRNATSITRFVKE
jgi:hypothetical protein